MVLSRGFAALIVMAFLTNAALAQSATYSLSGGNTKVEFVGAKKDGSHSGGFKKLSGTATIKGSDPATLSLSVVIDVDSMVTDNAKLTGHLKSPDFFEVKRYPEAKFVSTAVTKAKSGYTVSGNLTMHGETKKLTFPADIAITPDGLKLVAKFTLDRNDWGISYGKGMIDDAVSMSVDVTAKK